MGDLVAQITFSAEAEVTKAADADTPQTPAIDGGDNQEEE